MGTCCRFGKIAVSACVFLGLAGTHANSEEVPGCSEPVQKRTEEAGCYLTGVEALGTLPAGKVYWHLYTYPTRAAAEAIERPNGFIVESFGRIWLYVIADENWRPSIGVRVAVVGPLQTIAGKRYTARYMEEVRQRGAGTADTRFWAHRHPGVEAFYVLSGTLCLETPQGIMMARTGETMVMPEGSPMAPSRVGTETVREVFVVLHDEAQFWIAQEADWTPKGLCTK
jgi:mannose-6-phosphate isomerase-like protein (cupin superfamily)